MRYGAVTSEFPETTAVSVGRVHGSLDKSKERSSESTPAVPSSVVTPSRPRSPTCTSAAAARSWLVLLTDHRTYEIHELARQVLKDLGPVVIALDRIEQASAPQDAQGAAD